MRKIFLACPYSHVDEAVVNQRFNSCNQVAAAIIESGNLVFSQVTLSHPINQVMRHTAKQDIGKRWAPVDAFFMGVVDELIIVDLPGWDKSIGIQREIEFFEQRGQRVSLWSEVEDEFIAS
ncbi:uncharacterized protein DUF1937 [Raoultella sp. BIGb0149]|uniref:DUF1937 family protein n=1 Tax=Raoultella TaxID=160674 RepID=UPI00105B83E4|nr:MULTISPECIES: DUF1937 family protein [Raoultella]MCI1035741.1 DUF1937 family protein [Raoultella terrigena]TDQ27010.1 uncharacterized protein DUF1937 [Raoultella sp. BIGb0149]